MRSGMNVIKSGRALLLLALALALSGCDKARGVAAVKELCAKDGGERIFQTTYAAGYLTNDDSYFCRLCIELLGDRKFEYVDSHHTGVGEYAGRYFRYSLGKRGNETCEDWVGVPVEADRLLRQLDIQENECVVVAELPERPVGPALSQQWRTLVRDGVTVRLNEWTLTDERRGILLAQVKDYQFTSKLTAFLDMSGGGGNPDARCLDPGAYGSAVSKVQGRSGQLLRDATNRSGKN